MSMDTVHVTVSFLPAAVAIVSATQSNNKTN